MEFFEDEAAALEAVACECYGVIKAELDGVIARALIRFGGVQTPAVRAYAGRLEQQEVDHGED